MAYDFKLSAFGDWELAANHDIEGMDGAGLIAQRIITRIRIPRGTWIHDVDGTLGSDLALATSQVDHEMAMGQAPDFIAQALEPMDDAEIVDIQMRRHEEDPNAIVAFVRYRMSAPPQEPLLEHEDFDFLEEVQDVEPGGEEYVVVIPIE